MALSVTATGYDTIRRYDTWKYHVNIKMYIRWTTFDIYYHFAMIDVWSVINTLSISTVTYGHNLGSRAEELSQITRSGYKFVLALAADCCLYCMLGHVHQFEPTVSPQYSLHGDSRNTRMSTLHCEAVGCFFGRKWKNAKPQHKTILCVKITFYDNQIIIPTVSSRGCASKQPVFDLVMIVKNGMRCLSHETEAVK